MEHSLFVKFDVFTKDFDSLLRSWLEYVKRMYATFQRHSFDKICHSLRTCALYTAKREYLSIFFFLKKKTKKQRAKRSIFMYALIQTARKPLSSTLLVEFIKFVCTQYTIRAYTHMCHTAEQQKNVHTFTCNTTDDRINGNDSYVNYFCLCVCSRQ